MSAFNSALRRGRPVGSRLPRPIESPGLPVPAQNRLRLDHTEMASPAFRPEVAKPTQRTRSGARRCGCGVVRNATWS